MTTPDQSAALATAREVATKIANYRFANKPYEANVRAIARAILLAMARQAHEDTTMAVIHSQHPIEDDFDRGYDKGRKDAAKSIRARADELKRQAGEIAP